MRFGIAARWREAQLPGGCLLWECMQCWLDGVRVEGLTPCIVRPVQVFGTKGAYRCLLEEQRVRALLCCDGMLGLQADLALVMHHQAPRLVTSMLMCAVS